MTTFVPVNPHMSTSNSDDFEKWIRMATDNKINTANSWDLALIDYFHDLSLLRDGDGINFQKASATLDGCVKIYSSRVDSAATETGRLISGLSSSKTSNTPSKELNDDEASDQDDDADNIINVNNLESKRRSKTSRSNKNTLVDFDTIKLKKMDIDLHVDPIFKKALTDFDEGGSKSLLLNILTVDEDQRIVFDTTDSSRQRDKKHLDDSVDDLLQRTDIFEKSFAEMEIDDDDQELSTEGESVQDVSHLGSRYFNHTNFDQLTVCPSIHELKNVINLNTNSSDLLRGLADSKINFETTVLTTDAFSTSYDNFDLSFGGAPELDDDFGKEASIDPNNSKYPGTRTSIFFDDLEDEEDDYGQTMRDLFGDEKSFVTNNDILSEAHRDEKPITTIPDLDLIAYFDQNQKKSWAGPDHWKVQKLKRSYQSKIATRSNESVGQSKESKKEKQRQNYFIDFLSDEYPDEEAMFEPAGNSSLSHKKEWFSKTKNVLPDDKHFSTRNFIYLFQKPLLINRSFNKVENLDVAIDETFYAANLSQNAENIAIPSLNNPDFFNDNNGPDFDDDGLDYDNNSTSVPFTQSSTQILNKNKTSQSPLTYSRVAKKVDIKLLKDNLWMTLSEEKSSRKSLEPIPNSLQVEETLVFSEVIKGLDVKYDSNTKKDLSTSFCFICLLHLANENGFTISNNVDHTDLIINGV